MTFIERRKYPRINLTPKVLICDDDSMLGELLDIRLKQIGCEAVVVHDCEDCLAALKKEFFKVLLLDNVLPDGRGIDIILQIQEISPNTRIVLMTGYENRDDKLEALNLGAGFIEKPFDALKIVAKLKSVLAG